MIKNIRLIVPNNAYCYMPYILPYKIVNFAKTYKVHENMLRVNLVCLEN